MKPKVFLVGGPDIDARLDLMRRLQDKFELAAIGSNPDLYTVFEKNGFDYYHYPLAQHINPLNDLITIIKLIKIFHEEKPSVIHTFGTKPCALARIAARLANVPVIIGTIAGLGILYRKEGLKYSTIRFFYEALQKNACHFSDLTIFQNKDDREKFISRGIVCAEKTKLIPGSGILTEKFNLCRFSSLERDQIRKELDIPHDAFVVTMVARVIRSKGVIEFCDAANALKEEGKFAFLLNGSVDEGTLDRLSAKEIEYIRNSVIWLKKRKDIDRILASSDLFAFPSNYGEGIPRALLEAGSMKLPLIATDLPGCRAIIEGGKNGILIPPNNSAYLIQAIRCIAASKTMQQNFGKISRIKVVNTFDLKHIVKKTEEIYTDLLKISQT